MNDWLSGWLGSFDKAAPANSTAVAPSALRRIPRLEDFKPGAGAVLAEEVGHRPVQLLAKTLAAAVLPEVKIPLPLGGGVVTRKTPNERLKFELGLSRQEVQGKMFDEAMAKYLAAKKSGAFANSLRGQP